MNKALKKKVFIGETKRIKEGMKETRKAQHYLI